jgi:hypothetical protein
VLLLPRYEFCWEPHGPASSSSSSPFRCTTRKGTIGPGRQFEMVFEYMPQADEKAEAFWVRKPYCHHSVKHQLLTVRLRVANTLILSFSTHTACWCP